ncbi:MAG TPA: methyltransferase domain-containing protein [Acidimicrobiia bacterium]|nr:methyltransferase domain-containing protein [Acidimicrobiia bacterium]
MPDAPDPTRAARPGGFDGVTGRVAARIMARLNADMERAALDALDPQPGDRVLVIGFGPGVGIAELLRRVPDATVVGIDPSTAMVRAATRRLPAGAAVELLPEPLETLEATGPPFDRAVAVNCHQCFAPHDVALAHLRGVLVGGGRFVSLTHDWAIEKHQPVPAWRRGVEQDAATAGFSAPAWSAGRYRSGAATQLVLTASHRAEG